nr:MAG TPA: hypothetical protein [Caudoviricetes sp.]DAV51049.1 MAG TPA: hypothetical protein [Bacteriophage sp.]
MSSFVQNLFFMEFCKRLLKKSSFYAILFHMKDFSERKK